MSAGDVTLLAPISIQGDDTKVIARAKSIGNGFAVCDTTARNLISAEAKLGGFVVYNTTTSQLEWWNGAAWVAVGGSSGGGGMGFRFTYSATTTDSDPGAGTLRGNNVTLSSVTALFVDVAEFGGTDVTAWLDSLDDYTGAIKGIVRLSSQSDPTKWIEYTMTGWTTASGYRKLTVAYKDGPGGLTTTAGDTFLAFDYASADIPSQLPARGTENVVIDLYPSSTPNGTIATANTLNFDIAVPAGKRASITASIWVDNGAAGACLYAKELRVMAHITGGAAVKVADVTGFAPLEGAGFTFTAVANSTNIRFSLANTSGSTRSYNLAVGSWSMDLP